MGFGLVTHREQNLLFNEDTDTTRDSDNVISTVAIGVAVGSNGNLKLSNDKST